MKCPRCEYEWESKTLRPKECPRCKGRLDYQPGVVGAPKTWKKKEVRKEMTSKLPWATAATIIVVAAVGASLWLLPAAEEGVTPTPTPAPGAWTQFVLAWPTDNSGLENVYFMNGDNFGDDNEDNIEDTHENIIIGKGGSVGVIMRNPAAYGGADNAFTDNLNYNDNFYFIVRALVHQDNVANTQCENIKIRLTTAGAWSIAEADENRTGDTGADNLWIVTGSSEGSTDIQVNGIWDNDGNGYQLLAGDNITVTVRLYLWK